jgi:hypothetical protein
MKSKFLSNVLTPGGWRPKSKVFRVEPGHHIDAEGGRLRVIHTATGKVVRDFGEIPKPESTKKTDTSTPRSRKKKKKPTTRKK